MRKKIYEMVHVYDGHLQSIIYKWFMIGVIVVSLIPLTFKDAYQSFSVIDKTCLIIFVVDYVLRLVTADYKFQRFHWSSFVKYPFRLISIIDLLSILALLFPMIGWLKVPKITGALKVFRVVRIFRYSKSIRTILDILQKSKKSLAAVGNLAIGYIFVSAIIMFNVEPESFPTFFDAVYWSTVSLTTVGYGDLYPVTTIGRTVAMISSFFGIAIVALPSGVVTAEYLNTIKENYKNKED